MIFMQKPQFHFLCWIHSHACLSISKHTVSFATHEGTMMQPLFLIFCQYTEYSFWDNVTIHFPKSRSKFQKPTSALCLGTNESKKQLQEVIAKILTHCHNLRMVRKGPFERNGLKKWVIFSLGEKWVDSGHWINSGFKSVCLQHTQFLQNMALKNTNLIRAQLWIIYLQSCCKSFLRQLWVISGSCSPVSLFTSALEFLVPWNCIYFIAKPL